MSIAPIASRVALVVASLLYARATLSATPPPPSLVCQSAEQCKVRVEVSCSQTPCTIKVDHSNVAARGQAVVWEIVPKSGQSYVFKNPGGVAFKTAAGQRAFSCRAQMNGKQYRCQGDRDRNTYEYGIELSGTPPVKKLDPWIVND